MDADARAELSRFSALKHDIDLAVDTVTASTTAEGEAARLISRALPLSDPLPPAKCPLTGPDLDLAMERHNSDSEKLDQLDVGDFDQLRSLAKAASDKEMDKEDADLVELTLNTLFAFDQLRFLLRQRSITLNLFSLRAQWEDHRAKILSDEQGLRSDLSAFIAKARWTTPADIATPRKRMPSARSKAATSSPRQRVASTNSGLMARRMRSDILSLDVARLSQRLHALLHVAIKKSGKALDGVIDHSPVAVPEVYLDLQDQDEDRVSELERGAIGFLQLLARQWKGADDIAYQSQEVKHEAETIQREAESGLRKMPNEFLLQEYQSLLDEHSRKLDTCRSHIHDPAHLPKPTHDLLAPDQPQASERLVAELVHITDKAHSQLSITASTLQKYGRALHLLKRAQDIRTDAEAALATIHNLHRLISQQTARVPPDDGIHALDSPATDDERRLADLCASLEAELESSKETVEAGYASVKEVRSTGIDPNFSRETQSVLDALAAEQKPSLNVLSGTRGLLAGLKDARKTGRASSEYLEEVQGRFKVLAERLRQRLWTVDRVPDGRRQQEEEALSTSFNSVREGLERVREAHDHRRGLQEAAQCRLSACRSAQEDDALLNKLCNDASSQCMAVDSELQRMSALSEALEAATASINDSEDVRFSELERKVNSQLHALHQAVPFLCSPAAARLAASHAGTNLEAHDASVRQAINTASASLSSRLSALKQHRFRLQQLRRIESLKTELHNSRSCLAELESQIAQAGDTIKSQPGSAVLKSLLAQLPSPLTSEGHRSTFVRVQESFVECSADVKGFDDLALECSQAQEDCADMLARMELASTSSSELSNRILALLSAEEARQAALARQKAEEEAQERQSRQRHESWSVSLERERQWLEDFQHSLGLQRDEAASQDSAGIQSAIEVFEKRLEILSSKQEELGDHRNEVQNLLDQTSREARWSAEANTRAAAVQHIADELSDRLETFIAQASARLVQLQQDLSEAQEEGRKQALRAKIADASRVLEPTLAVAEDSLRGFAELLSRALTIELKDAVHDVDQGLENAAAATSQAERAVQAWGVTFNDTERSSQEVMDAANGHQQHLQTILDRRSLLQQEADVTQQSLHSRIEEETSQQEARRRAQEEDKAEQERKAADEARRQAAIDALSQRHVRIAKAVDSFEESVASGQHKTPFKAICVSADVPLGAIHDLQQASSQDLDQLSRDLSDLQQGGMTKSDSMQSLLDSFHRTRSRLQAASAELDTLGGQDAPEPRHELEGTHEHEDPGQSSFTSAPSTWIEDFESLSTAVTSLRDSRIPSHEDNTLQITDLKQRLATLKQNLPTDPQLRVSDQFLQSVEHDVEHVDAMNAFQVKKAAADNHLSHLLVAIDSCESSGDANSPVKPAHSRASKDRLRKTISQTTMAVSALKDLPAPLRGDKYVSETTKRIQTTWQVMQDMAQDALNDSSTTLNALSPPPTPYLTPPSKADVGRRSASRTSAASAATSSRIPRLRSPTNDIAEMRQRTASSLGLNPHQHTPHSGRTSRYGNMGRGKPPVTPTRQTRVSSTGSHRSVSGDMASYRSSSNRSLSDYLKKPRYSPASKRAVDLEVARVVNSMEFKKSIPIRSKPGDTYEDQSGRYFIGDRVYFCRILRSRILMVRVGGGWQELRSFLQTHFSHLLADDDEAHDGDISGGLLNRPQETPRAASLSVTRKRESSAEPDLLKLVTPEKEGSPSPVWR